MSAASSTGELALPPAPDGMDGPEWAVRCELAALYRLVAHFRMTDLIDTHISARVPGPQQHFLINRYGLLFEEMRASDLVKVDLGGTVVDERAVPDDARFRVNRAGFTIHSAVHGARPDLHWVIHTHTAAGGAVSAQEAGLLPISQHALKFHGRLAYHDYEGIALGLDNALAGGQALRVPGVQVQALTAEQFETADSAEIVQLTWQAARRLIDAQAAQFQS